jgi:hypothetical protein
MNGFSNILFQRKLLIHDKKEKVTRRWHHGQKDQRGKGERESLNNPNAAKKVKLCFSFYFNYH